MLRDLDRKLCCWDMAGRPQRDQVTGGDPWTLDRKRQIVRAKLKWSGRQAWLAEQLVRAMLR